MEKDLRRQALITLKIGFSQLSASADTLILYVLQSRWLQSFAKFLLAPKTCSLPGPGEPLVQGASKLRGTVILDGVHVFNPNATHQSPIETGFDGYHISFDQGHALVIQQGRLMDCQSQSMSGAMGHGDGIAGVVFAGEPKGKPMGVQRVNGGLVDGGSFHARSQGVHRGFLGRHHRGVHALNLI